MVQDIKERLDKVYILANEEDHVMIQSLREDVKWLLEYVQTLEAQLYGGDCA